MAEQTTTKQDAFETFRPSAEVYAHDLFNGAKSGTDLPESLRTLIAQIPDLDENDGRRRWSFDSLATDLTTDPADIDETDVTNLQRMTAEFITAAQTPEHKELAAQIIFLQMFGPRYKVPEGEKALDNLDPLRLKLSLRDMTVRQNPETGTTIMGSDVAEYAISHATVSHIRNDEKFIAALGDTLTQIQQDMREMGASMPEGNEHGLIKPADKLQDSARLLILEKAMAPLGENDALKAIRAEANAETRIEAYAGYIASATLSDADKATYTNALSTLQADKPVLDQLALGRDLGLMSDYDYNRHVLYGIQDVGLDRTGRFGEETKRYLDAYLDYMTHDNGYGTPAMRARALAFSGFMDLYEAVPEAQRTAVEQRLDHDSTDAPGIKTAPSPGQDAPLTEDQKAKLSPAQLAALQVLERMGAAGGVPVSVTESITNPQKIAGLPYAHLDEAFQQSTKGIMADNMERIYGIRNPLGGDVNERIRGGDGELIQFWFDSNNTPYEFQQQQDGSYTLHKVDPFGNVDAAPVPPEETPTLFEHHVHPDGSISRYLLGDNGQLFSSYADLSPVMLEAKHPDFDINHPNFVTTRFLDKIAQAEWADIRVSAKLDDMGKNVPAAAAIDTKMDALDTVLTEHIQTYYKDRGEDPSNQQISDLIKDLKSGTPNSDTVQQKLGVQNDAQKQSSDAIMTLLVQLNALDSFRDTVATRDYSRYIDRGPLPGGLGLNPPQTQVEWYVNWDSHFNNGELKWRTVQEGRIFANELNQIYDNALKTGTTIDASLFKNSAYATSYIEQQGWADGQLNYFQTSMVGRALMLKESADRHGIADPNSAEAKAAFVEDFRGGKYHWHDVEMFMRSFDSDQQRLSAKLEASEKIAVAQNQFDYGASVMHRSEMFNELFGTDVALTDKEGNVLATAENATITRDDAVQLFWQSYGYREEFTDPKTDRPYDRGLYHLGYDEMVERHGAEFAQSIEHIMENRSLFQQFMIEDANNPQGDQRALYERRYMANIESRIEDAVKREYDVIPEPAPAPVIAATLDPELDIVTEAPDNEQPDTTQPDSTAPDAAQPDATDPSAAALPPTMGLPPMKRAG